MPTTTFLNLPADKRDRIVELAIAEFSERPYAQASLSRIVARAGIAKGSMYQYFADKLDLYRWLVVEELGRRKQAFFADAAPPTGDLRARLRAMCLAGLRFALAQPRVARVAAHALEPSAEPGLRALHAEMRAAGVTGVEALLRAAQAAGEVRADLPVGPAAALLAAALGPGLMDVLLARLGVDMAEFLADPTVVARLAPGDAEALVDSLLDVVWRGLGPATPTTAATRRKKG
jgi:AcrR family transcriptional regulator